MAGGEAGVDRQQRRAVDRAGSGRARTAHRRRFRPKRHYLSRLAERRCRARDSGNLFEAPACVSAGAELGRAQRESQ